MAMRPSAPAVAVRPSLSSATALTASAWKRSTCSAALRVSDQRIAVESKLPVTAVCPSDEIANARTGPPWPRNCAEAVVIPTGNRASKVRNMKRRFGRERNIHHNRLVRSLRRQGPVSGTGFSACSVCQAFVPGSGASTPAHRPTCRE
jgi:hypothetical protein